MIKYSICMCNYNMENTLYKSVSSIGEQLDDKFEIIIVDDGSTDNSLNILKKLKEKYRFLKIIKLKRSKNRRLGFTRNISISHAEGEYVLLHIDCDDVYDNHILDFIKAFHLIESWEQKDFLLKGMQINMAKKSFLLKHGPYRNIFYVEDRDLWIRMASLNNLIILKHKIFRTRMTNTLKNKIIKNIKYTFKITKQNMELGGIRTTFIDTLKSKGTINIKIFKLLTIIIMLPFVKLYKFEIETLNYKIFSNLEWSKFKETNTLDLSKLAKAKNKDIKLESLNDSFKKIFL